MEGQGGPGSGGFGYTTMLVGEDPVAGLSPMFQPGQPVAWTMSVLTASADASPAVWLMSVFVDDIALASAAVRAGGGSVLMEAVGALDYGQFAVVADRHGAVFELFEPAGFAGTTLFDEPGALAWTELDTCDLEGAKAFYGDAFGWKAVDGEVSGSQYVRWFADDRQFGGLTTLGGLAHTDGAFPHWLVYFAVSDVDAVVGHAVMLGASVVSTPQVVPDSGRFAVLTDPQGAVFAVYAAD